MLFLNLKEYVSEMYLQTLMMPIIQAEFSWLGIFKEYETNDEVWFIDRTNKSHI